VTCSAERPYQHICTRPDGKRKKAETAYLLLARSIGEVPLSIHHRRYEVLRKQLRLVRRSAGLTQVELAHRLKIDQSYVSKVERGERYVDILFYLDWCRACRYQPEIALMELIAAGA
jgi:DNA-binding XRE family transcriptional regulator